MHDDGPSSSPIPARGAGPSRGSGSNLYTLFGMALALAAAAVYYFAFLRPARQRQLEQVARVSSVEGAVKIKSGAAETWSEVTVGQGVRGGDVIETAAESGAELVFNDGGTAKIASESVVRISDESDANWRVQTGQVNFALNRATEIETPTASTRAEANTEGKIDIGAGGDSRYTIFRGKVEITTAQGDLVVLNENEGVQLDGKGKAGPKSALPPAPAPMAPAALAELPFKALPGVTATLEWKPVTGGATYRVAVDYNVRQADLLIAAALDQAGIVASAHDLKGLNPGKYYWRVAGVNSEGLEGAYSKVSVFAVTTAPEPTPEPARARLSVEAVDDLGNVVALRGRTAPGSVVSVEGVELKVQPDGSFSEFLRKTGRVITVKVTGPGGEVAEETRPVS
jgi:hypothetical protein